MHERRNMAICLLLVLFTLWAAFSWLIAPDYAPGLPPNLMWHKIASVALMFAFGGWLFWIWKFEDRLDDQLAEVTGGVYYERDGLCFMPLIRIRPGSNQAEISLYYQNRYSSPVEAVIHLRPLVHDGSPPFASHRDARDLHFAFIAQPGAFGVLHQPIAVAPGAQGEVINVHVGAAVRWPRGKGDELRSHGGTECGTFNVDWALAFRRSTHELGGEIDLEDPATLHLSMPMSVSARIDDNKSSQETIFALS